MLLVHLVALLLAIVVTGAVNPTTMILMSDYDTITPGCHQIMTLCCCPCFASSVASWTSWRRVASLCSCPCITSRHGLLGVTSHHVVSRRSCHALHVVASHRFASRIVIIAMDRFFFLPLACRGTLLRVSEVCGNVRKVW